MAVLDEFVTKIIARFDRDFQNIGSVIEGEVIKTWEVEDAVIVEELVDTTLADVDRRIDMATESMAWQGEQVGRIDAIDESGYLFGWELDPAAQHCDDCISRSQGGPYTMNDLLSYVGLPGDAPTECDGGCRCRIIAWA